MIVLWEAAALYVRMTNPWGDGDGKDDPSSSAGAHEQGPATKTYAAIAQAAPEGLVSRMAVKKIGDLDPLARSVVADLLKSEG